jgi:uncharacterized protein YkwD
MKKGIKIILVILAIIGVLGITAAIYIAYIILKVDYKFTGQQLFDEINAYRASKELSQLKSDPILCDNLVERYLAVKEPGNGHKGFEEWLKSEGIKISATDNSKYIIIRELYVTGVSTPANAIRWWLGSPGHKSTLEMPVFDKGCSYANDGTGVVIMAQSAKH